MILIVMICRFCLCLIIFGRRVLILVVNLNVTVIMITQVILFLNGILDMVSVMFLMVIVIIHVRITVIARGLNRLTIFLLFYRCYYCGYYYDPYYPRDKPQYDRYRRFHKRHLHLGFQYRQSLRDGPRLTPRTPKGPTLPDRLRYRSPLRGHCPTHQPPRVHRRFQRLHYPHLRPLHLSVHRHQFTVPWTLRRFLFILMFPNHLTSDYRLKVFPSFRTSMPTNPPPWTCCHTLMLRQVQCLPFQRLHLFLFTHRTYFTQFQTGFLYQPDYGMFVFCLHFTKSFLRPFLHSCMTSLPTQPTPQTLFFTGFLRQVHCLLDRRQLICFTQLTPQTHRLTGCPRQKTLIGLSQRFYFLLVSDVRLFFSVLRNRRFRFYLRLFLRRFLLRCHTISFIILFPRIRGKKYELKKIVQY